MSRAATGTYTRPSNSFSNPVVGQTVSPTDADALFDDIETELTDSYSRSIKGGMLANGTALLPAFTWSSDLNTGIYRIGADNLGIAVGGVKIIDVGSAAVTSSVDISVPDEVYDGTNWNGSLEVPTKNAVRDKIEVLQPLHARLTDISGITYAQGDVFYYNGSNIVKLAAGSSGQFLKTLGAAANPAWASIAGGGDVLGPGASTDNAAVRFDSTTGTAIQNSALIIADTTGAISRSGNGGIPVQGTNTNDNAAAADIGEYAQSGPTSATLATGVTISNASPGIISWTAHGMLAGTAVNFTTTGTLPTGFTTGTNYYVCAGATLVANSFALASSAANALAGTCINTSSAGSGSHTAISKTLLTSGAYSNTAAISLTAGDWDVGITTQFDGGASTVVNYLFTSVSTTSATSDLTNGRTSGQPYPAGFTPFGTAFPLTLTLSRVRLSLSGTTNVYAMGTSNHTTSTLSAYSTISARRVR